MSTELTFYTLPRFSAILFSFQTAFQFLKSPLQSIYPSLLAEMAEPAAGAQAEQYAIGISFGNSNSSIAHISGEGKVEVIANEEGDRQIPSILSYVDGEEYHGTQAKQQLVRNSKNTVAYFKDFVGKDFKSIDPTFCNASAHPVANESITAFSIRDSPEGDEHNVTVSEITTRHMRRLKTSASDYTGKTITAAVMSIPTDSTDEQKAALSKAASEAGIQILQFIPEPIAALLAYESRSTESPSDKIVVVADFGGTRSDTAVVAARDGMYSILATAHDYDLGGLKLDQVLMEYIAKEFMKKHKTDPRSEPRGLAKLRLESEAVKKSLSQSASATFSVESLADGIDYRLTVNRTRYEMIASTVFRGFTRLVEEAIRKADLDVLDIDEVILSGGTAATPRIASNLQSMFPESTLILSPSTSPAALYPSELAARGAALQASLVQEFDKEDIDQSTHEMVTVTPHLHNAIGVQLTSKNAAEGNSTLKFSLVIPPSSALPVRRTKSIAAPAGNVLVSVCEATREIKVSKPEAKSKPTINGRKDIEDDADDSDLDSDDDEPEETRSKVWKPKSTPLAELAFHDLKKKAKIEVTINVAVDLSVSVTARPVGGKGGLRAQVGKPDVVENGSAHL